MKLSGIAPDILGIAVSTIYTSRGPNSLSLSLPDVDDKHELSDEVHDSVPSFSSYGSVGEL